MKENFFNSTWILVLKGKFQLFSFFLTFAIIICENSKVNQTEAEWEVHTIYFNLYWKF